MKEKIYTIPVNEAFDTDCECPLCFLNKNLEKEAVDYALGAAMMESDYRIISNEKGYCNKHYSMMLPKKEKLSLSLVLETHLDEVIKKIDGLKENVNSLKKEKRPLFKKKKDNSEDEIISCISGIINSCVICDKLIFTMQRYISVLFYMWEKEEDFRQKLINSKGFCLVHFNMLCDGAFKYLSKKKAIEFLGIIYEKELVELTRLKEETHKFSLKFDYRNQGEKWGSEIDAPKRTIEKLSGYLDSNE